MARTKTTTTSDPATKNSTAPVEPNSPTQTSIQAASSIATGRSAAVKTGKKTDDDGINGTSEESGRKRHMRRKAWFTAEMQRQAVNRYQMALDEDYKDGIQWTPEEAAAVRARGQNPVVYNEVKPTIDWMIGTERARAPTSSSPAARTTATRPTTTRRSRPSC
jgi:hypothetical protein